MIENEGTAWWVEIAPSGLAPFFLLPCKRSGCLLFESQNSRGEVDGKKSRFIP